MVEADVIAKLRADEAKLQAMHDRSLEEAAKQARHDTILVRIVSVIFVVALVATLLLALKLFGFGS